MHKLPLIILYNHRRHPVLEFCRHPVKTSLPVCHSFPFLPQPQVATGLLPVSKRVTPLDISYEWDYTIFGILWLASFTLPSFWGSSVWFKSLFHSSDCRVGFHCTAVPHLAHLITSWQTFGTVSTFWLLWTMLLRTFQVPVFLRSVLSFLWVRCQGIELLGRMVMFNFKKLLWFSKWFAPFYVLTNKI